MTLVNDRLTLPGALARHRPEADVAPAESVRPADAVDRRIGARLRLADGLAERRHVENTAAVGEDPAAFRPGAGVEDLDALHLGGIIEPRDHRALGVAAGIALGRHHHGECGIW